MRTGPHTYIHTYTYTHIQIYIYIKTYIYMHTITWHDMTKENIYGNIHTHAYILNLYDLIPKNSQTHPIKFLGMLGNIIYIILYIFI